MTRVSLFGIDSGRNPRVSHFSYGSNPCPKTPDQVYKYNVFRYFSRNRVFKLFDETKPDQSSCPSPASITKNRGVIGDGGVLWHQQFKYDRPEGDAQMYNNTYFGSDYPLASHMGYENFLAISNNREFLKYDESEGTFEALYETRDRCRPSLHHLFVDDDLRKPTEDPVTIQLFKKNHSETFTDEVNTEEMNETGDLMEFLHLHTHIKKCQKGTLYVELYDLDITGATSDGMLYVYVSEIDRQAHNSQAQCFKDISNQISQENFYSTGTRGNRCSQAVRISDIAGNVTDKKIILNTGITSVKGQEKFVSIIIGLKPAEVDYSAEYYSETGSGSLYPSNAMNYSEIGSDVKMTYTKVRMKLKNFGAEVNNVKPLFSPSEGFIDLVDNDTATAMNDPWLRGQATYMVLDALGRAWNGVGTHSGNWGLPNGNTTSSQSYVLGGATSVDVPSSLLPAQSFILIRDGKHLSSTYVHLCNASDLDRTKTFILRIPRCQGAWSGAMSGHNSLFDTISGVSSVSANVVLFAGEMTGRVNPSVGGTVPAMKVFADSLQVVQSWPVATFYSQARDYYHTAESYNVDDTTSEGVPSQVHNTDTNVVSDWLYVEIDLSLYDAIDNLNFWLGWQVDGIDVRSNNSGTLSSTTSRVPTGNLASSDFNAYPQKGATLYLRPVYEIQSGSNTFMNYGAMMFRAPQIIEVDEEITAENYYS